MRIRNRHSKQIVCERINGAGVVGSTRAKNIFAIDVEEEFLVKLLIANVAAEFEVMLADDLAVVLVELKSVSGLRQLPFKVVPKQAELDVKGLGQVIQFMSEAGELKPPLPPPERFVDLQYLKAAGLQ